MIILRKYRTSETVFVALKNIEETVTGSSSSTCKIPCIQPVLWNLMGPCWVNSKGALSLTFNSLGFSCGFGWESQTVIKQVMSRQLTLDSDRGMLKSTCCQGKLPTETDLGSGSEIFVARGHLLSSALQAQSIQAEASNAWLDHSR